uniref:Uncharacterized protein n=1 Tax=Knipowitschia caucasica TaxID=637954 RepID=A0AAV2IZ21_KNICA
MTASLQVQHLPTICSITNCTIPSHTEPSRQPLSLSRSLECFGQPADAIAAIRPGFLIALLCHITECLRVYGQHEIACTSVISFGLARLSLHLDALDVGIFVQCVPVSRQVWSHIPYSLDWRD